MATESCSISTALLKSCSIPPFKSAGSPSLSPQLLRLSPSNCRSRSSVSCSPSNAGEPAKKIGDKNPENGSQSPPPPSSPPLPKTPSWLKWTLGSIVWLSLPSWKKMQTVNQVVSQVDTAVEVIESMAELTETMASKVAEDLPEGNKVKEMMLKVEHASEGILKNAQVIDDLLDKVQEIEDKLKNEDKKEKAERKKAKEGIEASIE